MTIRKVDQRALNKDSTSQYQVCRSAHARKRRQLVAVKIAFEEQALRAVAKRNGARWSSEQRVWIMPGTVAVTLGIKRRIVEGLAEQCSDVELYDD